MERQAQRLASETPPRMEPSAGEREGRQLACETPARIKESGRANKKGLRERDTMAILTPSPRRPCLRHAPSGRTQRFGGVRRRYYKARPPSAPTACESARQASMRRFKLSLPSPNCTPMPAAPLAQALPARPWRRDPHHRAGQRQAFRGVGQAQQHEDLLAEQVAVVGGDEQAAAQDERHVGGAQRADAVDGHGEQLVLRGSVLRSLLHGLGSGCSEAVRKPRVAPAFCAPLRCAGVGNRHIVL